ncbi:MAG: hypothetical protein E6J90_15975 [Deltaproteobacteria bacterium]|nr:MAG: hypothetical protein E6J90_15975 [Deltaproteobacteria bacterium]
MKGAVNGVWVAAAVALVVGACALGGCEPRITAGFSSRLYSANAPPIERLLIVPDMKSQAFGDSMYHGFETGLIKRLSLCGVQPRILVLDALELEPEQRFAQVANEFHATAAMFINPLGGKLQRRIQAARVARPIHRQALCRSHRRRRMEHRCGVRNPDHLAAPR